MLKIINIRKIYIPERININTNRLPTSIVSLRHLNILYQWLNIFSHDYTYINFMYLRDFNLFTWKYIYRYFFFIKNIFINCWASQS